MAKLWRKPKGGRENPTAARDVDDILKGRLEKVRTKKWRNRLIRDSVIAVLAVIVLFGIIFGIVVVNGSSMEPNLRDGDIGIFFRFIGSYKRGDIVLLKTSKSLTGRDYIKRVVGIPGDTVEIDNQAGELLIDGEAVSEDYIFEPTYSLTGQTSTRVVLGPGEYFVLGDNRDDSEDSRSFGPISKNEIEGKIVSVLRFGS